MATSTLITVVNIISSSSAGRNEVHSGQNGKTFTDLSEDYMNIAASGSRTIGPVSGYLYIESTGPLTATLTKPDTTVVTLNVNTILLLTNQFTSIILTNNTTAVVGAKVVTA